MKKYFALLFFCAISSVYSQKISCFDTARKGTIEDIKAAYYENPKILDSIDSKKSSMLILACYRGNTEVAQFLIEKKANINYVSPNGTALMATTVKGDIKLTTLLLKNGANTDLTDDNKITALMYAVQFKNNEIVSLLLKYNANKTLKDSNAKTAFEYAVFSGNQDIINLLK